MRLVVATLLACALVILVGARGAHAGPESEVTAKGRYAAGLRFVEAGDLERAIVEFEASYRLAPYAGLLFNIAECADKLGRADEAIARYEQYLAAAPRSSRREVVLARIATLRAARTTTPEPPPKQLPTATATEPTTPPAPARPTVAAPPLATTAIAAPARPAPSKRRWWPWAIAGIGAAAVVGVAVGVGVAYGTRGPDFHPNLPDIGPRTP